MQDLVERLTFGQPLRFGEEYVIYEGAGNWKIRIDSASENLTRGTVNDERYGYSWICDKDGCRYDFPERVPQYVKKYIRALGTHILKKKQPEESAKELKRKQILSQPHQIDPAGSYKLMEILPEIYSPLRNRLMMLIKKEGETSEEAIKRTDEIAGKIDIKFKYGNPWESSAQKYRYSGKEEVMAWEITLYLPNVFFEQYGYNYVVGINDIKNYLNKHPIYRNILVHELVHLYQKYNKESEKIYREQQEEARRKERHYFEVEKERAPVEEAFFEHKRRGETYEDVLRGMEDIYISNVLGENRIYKDLVRLSELKVKLKDEKLKLKVRRMIEKEISKLREAIKNKLISYYKDKGLGSIDFTVPSLQEAQLKRQYGIEFPFKTMEDALRYMRLEAKNKAAGEYFKEYGKRRWVPEKKTWDIGLQRPEEYKEMFAGLMDKLVRIADGLEKMGFYREASKIDTIYRHGGASVIEKTLIRNEDGRIRCNSCGGSWDEDAAGYIDAVKAFEHGEECPSCGRMDSANWID